MLFSKSRADLFGKIVKYIESSDYSGASADISSLK